MKQAVRIGALFCILLVGCRSTKAGKPRHDYLSVNREGIAFMKETARQARPIRSRSLRDTVNIGPEIRENRSMRKESLRFATQAAFGKPWTEFRAMLRNGTGTIREDLRGAGKGVRFGFLDSGE